MKHKLKEEEIKKLSRILVIDEATIRLLIIEGLLDYAGARAILIKNDYANLLKEGLLTKSNIVSALMINYKLSRSSIEKIIYSHSLGKKGPKPKQVKK